MNDDVMEPIDRGYLELARRLEAYADLRLTPSLAATTAMRASVMQAAHRRAAHIQADPTLVTGATVVAIPRKRAQTAPRHWRRPVAAMLAASLTLGIVAGTVSAASPGGPLYAARLWVEMANLPTDPMARADAELARLQDRLREAQRASSVGDGSAAEAALAAYSAILLEAQQGSDGNDAASAAIEGGVGRHVAVLTELVDQVPTTARPAIERALVSSTKVLDELHTKNTQSNGGGTTAPEQTGGSGGAAPAGQPANGGQTAKPDPTDKPAATPRSARPENSHPGKPDKTGAPAKPAPGTPQGSQGGRD
jgi:hypothetical protein